MTLSWLNRDNAGASAGRRVFGDWLEDSRTYLRVFGLLSDDDADDDLDFGLEPNGAGLLLLCDLRVGVELLSLLFTVTVSDVERPLLEESPSSRFGLWEWLRLWDPDCASPVSFVLDIFLPEWRFLFLDKSSSGISCTCDWLWSGDSRWRFGLAPPVCWLNDWYGNEAASSATSTTWSLWLSACEPEPAAELSAVLSTGADLGRVAASCGSGGRDAETCGAWTLTGWLRPMQERVTLILRNYPNGPSF